MRFLKNRLKSWLSQSSYDDQVARLDWEPSLHVGRPYRNVSQSVVQHYHVAMPQNHNDLDDLICVLKNTIILQPNLL